MAVIIEIISKIALLLSTLSLLLVVRRKRYYVVDDADRLQQGRRERYGIKCIAEVIGDGIKHWGIDRRHYLRVVAGQQCFILVEGLRLWDYLLGIMLFQYVMGL